MAIAMIAVQFGLFNNTSDWQNRTTAVAGSSPICSITRRIRQTEYDDMKFCHQSLRQNCKKIVNIIDWSFIKIKPQDLPNSLYYFMLEVRLITFFPVLESFKRINAVSRKIVYGWRMNIFLWVLNSIDIIIQKREGEKNVHWHQENFTPFKLGLIVIIPKCYCTPL